MSRCQQFSISRVESSSSQNYSVRSVDYPVYGHIIYETRCGCSIVKCGLLLFSRTTHKIPFTSVVLGWRLKFWKISQRQISEDLSKHSNSLHDFALQKVNEKVYFNYE